MQPDYDLLLATDMLDLATFLGLTRDITRDIPTALYFHENQLTYPLPAGRARDLAFPWVNYTASLAADALLFNSDFHRRAFLTALPSLVGRYHDHQELDVLGGLAAKAQVLPPGIDLARLDAGEQAPYTRGPAPRPPVIVWNSRWEYDKGPQRFFAALRVLAERGVDFRVIVAGEHVDPCEPNFLAAREWLGERVIAWGYAPSSEAYRERLWQADIVVSTALLEFFGIGVIEAMYCGCAPILPYSLSYPELLPPEHHAACLYASDDELVDKLHAAIQSLPERRPHALRGVAARYDWGAMAAQWDAVLAKIVERRGSRA
jgi:glycosyltransferase involved in cell wall biosynthesis